MASVHSIRAVIHELDENDLESFSSCRWFTRGWTLQELIAPRTVHFFDTNWKSISRKDLLIDTLKAITGNDRAALMVYEDARPHTTSNQFCIAERMHWASRRTTTGVEDQAYCLLGLFSINLPLLYGEGDRAFQRLQEAIVSTSTDTTIFAWELLSGDEAFHRNDLFAPSPARFGLYSHIKLLPAYGSNADPSARLVEQRLTNHGVHLSLPVHAWRVNQEFDSAFLVLGFQCGVGNQRAHVCLRIQHDVHEQGSSHLETMVVAEQESTIGHESPALRRLVFIPEHDPMESDRFLKSVNIALHGRLPRLKHEANEHNPHYMGYQLGSIEVYMRLQQTDPQYALQVSQVYPAFQWHAQKQSFTFSAAAGTCYGLIRVEIGPELSCVIVVGPAQQTYRSQSQEGRYMRSTGYLQYWLLPWRRRIPLNSKHLTQIMDYFSTSAAKDCFEAAPIRQTATKILVLPGDNIVRLAFDADPDLIALSDTRFGPVHIEAHLSLVVEPIVGQIAGLALAARVGHILDVWQADELGRFGSHYWETFMTWKPLLQLLQTVEVSETTPPMTCSWVKHQLAQARYSNIMMVKEMEIRCIDFHTAIFDRRWWKRAPADREVTLAQIK